MSTAVLNRKKPQQISVLVSTLAKLPYIKYTVFFTKGR